MNERLELRSPLPPIECARRIASAIDTDSLFSLAFLFGSNPVVGRVTESSLRLRRRIKYRNSFQKLLVVTMRPEGSGTVISGKFVMHPIIRVFTAIWFTGVIVIGGALFVRALHLFLLGSVLREDGVWQGLVFPPCMIVFGLLLTRFGTRADIQFIEDFLVEMLAVEDPLVESLAIDADWKIAETTRVCCPYCERIIYSRQHRKCGYCGKELPSELLLSEAEIAQLKAEEAAIAERRAKAKAKEEEDRRKRSGDSGGPDVGMF